MSISEFVNKLDKEQLEHAKEEIELRLGKYTSAKRVKFASLVHGMCRWCWIDCRDEEGWKLLEKEYVKAATEQFSSALKWCGGEYKRETFREELPQIEITDVNDMDYQEWLKDSLNPSFKVEEEN